MVRCASRSSSTQRQPWILEVSCFRSTNHHHKSHAPHPCSHATRRRQWHGRNFRTTCVPAVSPSARRPACDSASCPRGRPGASILARRECAGACIYQMYAGHSANTGHGPRERSDLSFSILFQSLPPPHPLAWRPMTHCPTRSSCSPPPPTAVVLRTFTAILLPGVFPPARALSTACPLP